MSTKFLVWQHLHRPASTLAPSLALNLEYRLVANAFRDLQRTGHIRFLRWQDRQAVYESIGELLPEGRGRAPGSASGRALGVLTRPTVIRRTTAWERRWDGELVVGYGSGRIALEDCWR